MKNLFLYAILLLLVLAGGFAALNAYIYNEKQADAADTPENATYRIEGESVTLKDGVHEKEAAPGSAEKIITRYFGNRTDIDFDGDGDLDAAFLLTQTRGGSGVFYYVAAALQTERGYVGSNTLLLGDRIAPQTTEVSQNPSHVGVIVVNYADRAAGEPMTAQPSIGKSIWLKLDPASMQFGEVVQDFSGEADPSKMTLGMKKWVWLSALYNDGTRVTPAKAGAFTLTLGSDGKFSATTDCNQMGGSYVAKAGKITFSDTYMTKMYCEGSQESVFAKLLSDSAEYLFTSRGELVLGLKFDSGSVVFR